MKLPADAPIIGVPMCVKHLDNHNFHTVGEKYLTAIIEAAGAYPLSFPALGEAISPLALLSHLDAVLFTGSPSNVAVQHYGGAPDRADSPQDPGRDAITLPLIRAAIAEGVPILCICRGFQELNVALGGTLHTMIHTTPGRLDHRGRTDVPFDEMYGPAHPIDFLPEGVFARLLGKTSTVVNSLHWQGIDRLADQLIAEGHAPDGVVEAVRVKDSGFALGAQWHPEFRATENPDSMRLFRAFGDAARARSLDRANGRGGRPQVAA